MSAAGTWTLTMQTPIGERKATLTLAVAGAALTGQLSAEGGNAVDIYEGKLAGADASWKADIKNPMPLTLEFAGTVNGEGALEVESTRPAGDTTLAHIIRLVGEAHTQRAPVEQWVDRFARVYTPAVFALAVLVALVPPLVAGGWADWVYRALVLLVIACPCALVI